MKSVRLRDDSVAIYPINLSRIVQEHLASLSGLSLRTIQRVESEGLDSLETRMALAAAFDVAAASLIPSAETAAQAQIKPEPTIADPPNAAPKPYANPTPALKPKTRNNEILIQQMLWAVAFLATALLTHSTLLCVVFLPALATISRIIPIRASRREGKNVGECQRN